jgi:hypothetical protein
VKQWGGGNGKRTRKRAGRHRLTARPARGLEWVVTQPPGQSAGRHRVPAPSVPAAGVIAAGAVLLATSAASPAVPVDTPRPPDPDRVGAVDRSMPAGAERGVNDSRRAPDPRLVPAVNPATDSVDTPADAGATIPAVFIGDIPATVLDAYRHAHRMINSSQPGCHLPLELLEAIGKVETNHARHGLVDSAGTTLSPIIGPALDGNGFAAIPDTDGGRWDRDTVWDHAVGPMQFIPSTWARWFADGNGDHRADPNNVYDTSLAAGRYLCAANRDLGTPQGLNEAIFSYNHSTSYRNLVLSWMSTYTNGTTAIPNATTPNPHTPTVIPAHTVPARTVTLADAPPPPAIPAAAGTPDAPPATQPPPSTPPTTPPPSTPPPTTPPTSTPPAPPPTTTSPAGPVQNVVCGITGLIGGLLGSLTGSNPPSNC